MKKNYKFWLGGLLLILLLWVQPGVSQAQCAMCTASVESSNNEDGDSIANGLNKGILYLMAVPYLLAGGIGFFWYRYSKRK
ncbi:hypothetical protein [Rufibacter psychrotolerans]|uniref:hypothetical protein n=1 Tax=Rufibacter psychrotolerans TaxID=2812556 RepID=UPI0019679AB4|nr:hypothetical protein [Rufibacter sp. SYSU D00308]